MGRDRYFGWMRYVGLRSIYVTVYELFNLPSLTMMIVH